MEKSTVRNFHWIRMLSWLLFGAVVVSGVACGGNLWLKADMEEGLYRALAARKKESLKEWEGKTIAGVPATEYVADRCFFLVHFDDVEFPADFDLDRVVVDFFPNASKRFPYGRVELNDRQADEGDDAGEEENQETVRAGGGGGTATPITNDGYFLTNAHVVDKEEATFYLWGAIKGGKKLFKARVVWIGDHGCNDLPDLALLHADVEPKGHFPFEGGKLPPVGDRIITGGYGGVTPNQASGKMLVHGIGRKWNSDVRWRAFIHDAALHPGDSGGPVISDEGELLGINALVHSVLQWPRNDLEGYKVRALQPDPEWLSQVIAADRAERAREGE